MRANLLRRDVEGGAVAAHTLDVVRLIKDDDGVVPPACVGVGVGVGVCGGGGFDYLAAECPACERLTLTQLLLLLLCTTP